MTAAELLASGVARLSRIFDPEEARREARLLLAHVTGWDALQLSIGLRDVLDPPRVTAFEAGVARRLAREPLSQIIGSAPFWGRDFLVNKHVLAPRPDSETLIDAALSQPFERLLDLGTGSGILAVTLLAERTGTSGMAVDLSPDALAVAGRNADKMGVSDRLELRQSDWFAEVEGRFDLIVSNPPYVSEAAYATLEPEVTQYEPRIALTPGGDGLQPYRIITANCRDYLNPDGRILVEIGFDQGPQVTTIFAENALVDIEVLGDLGGRDRVVSGHVPS